MKIAIDCRLIGTTGIGTFIENIVREIINYPDYYFILIGNSDILYRYELNERCTVIDCRFKSFTIQELFQFPVKDVNTCDAFFTPNFNIPSGIKIPIFCTIHDVVFFDIPDLWPLWQRLMFKWYINRALRISKYVFTVSEFSKSRILYHCPTKTPISVVHVFISKPLLEYKKCHHLSSERSGIIYLGNIKKHKGIDILLDAYLQLVKERNDLPLTILGRVDCRSKDDEIIRRINDLGNKIKFINNVPNEKLFKLIANSEVLVSPSRYEGFGLPPMEALTLGTNVIISDIPVYKEIYSNLPVSFFRNGDSNDLFMKLKDFKFKELHCSPLINQIYNYSVTSQTICDVIKTSMVGK